MTQQNSSRKLFLIIVLAMLSVSAVSVASATTISGNLTADNAFYAYLSTNDAVLGTLIASGNDWPTTFPLSAALTPGVTNYLHIEAINYGLWGGFLGQFALSDTGFKFANGTQTLLTETTDWAGIYNDGNSDPSLQQPWVMPTAGTVSFGANGVGPWGTRPGISGSADWIWPNDPASSSDPTYIACQFCTVDLSTPITPTPEPGTLVIFGSGLIGLAGTVRRKLML